MTIIKAAEFQSLGTTEWVAAARSVDRNRSAAPTNGVQTRTNVPPPALPQTQVGLRGMEATQDFDAQAARGRLVNVYV
jgi:hypothetical protein